MNFVRATILVVLLTNNVVGSLFNLMVTTLNRGVSMKEETRELTQIQPKLLGGHPAELHRYPYFAQYIDGEGRFRCGGSLIHSDVVLTAAHCDFNGSNSVIVGSYSLLNRSIGYPRNVVDRVPHPNWDPLTFSNDVQLLRIDSGVPTQTVKLNSNLSYPVTNELLTAIGLGYTLDGTEGGRLSNVLLETNFSVVDAETCANAYLNSTYGKYYGPVIINATIHLCTQVPGDGNNVCRGDSGGPVLDANGVQVGIVSFSEKPCGVLGFPSVQARVSAQYAWIREQVCVLSAYPPEYCYNKTLPTPTNVRFDVFYDAYPALTSVSIWNSSQSVSTTTGSGNATWNNTLVSTQLSLQPGYYYAQLYNSLGHGFCCKNGYGFVAGFAVVNGLYQPILPPTFASFNESWNIPMPVPEDNVETIVSYMGNGSIVRVEIFYDRFPNETSVVLVNSTNQAVVFRPGIGQASDANKLKVFHTTLPSGTYDIQLSDSRGDGFCGANGIGYYAVYTVASRSYQALIPPTYATFSDSTFATFSLPFESTAPTTTTTTTTTSQSHKPHAALCVWLLLILLFW